MSTSAIPAAAHMQNVLPEQQERVIAAISNGASVTEAAKQAGVHRNTVHYWRRSSPPFCAALAHAQYDRALLNRERAAALAFDAFEAIRQILKDSRTAPSVRLRAALAIMTVATTPPPAPPTSLFDPHPTPEKLHKTAQAAPLHVNVDSQPANAIHEPEASSEAHSVSSMPIPPLPHTGNQP
jgi:hypothetical protein